MQNRVDWTTEGPKYHTPAVRGRGVQVNGMKPLTRLSETTEEDTNSSIEEDDGEAEAEEGEYDDEEELDDDDEFDDEWYDDDEDEEEDEEGGEGELGNDRLGLAAASTTNGDGEGLEEEMVEVGIVIGAHGVRGEARVKPLTDFPEERFGQVR